MAAAVAFQQARQLFWRYGLATGLSGGPKSYSRRTLAMGATHAVIGDWMVEPVLSLQAARSVDRRATAAQRLVPPGTYQSSRILVNQSVLSFGFRRPAFRLRRVRCNSPLTPWSRTCRFLEGTPGLIQLPWLPNAAEGRRDNAWVPIQSG